MEAHASCGDVSFQQVQTSSPAIPVSTWRVSIVSHGHGSSVARVLRGLCDANPGIRFNFVITVNIPEDLSWIETLPSALRGQLQFTHNEHPHSFAYNHNQALTGGGEDYFLAADPELIAPFPQLRKVSQRLDSSHVGLVSPQALDEQGKLEDNGRSVPRLWAMLYRNLIRHREQKSGATYAPSGNRQVAWLAGFFLACRREVWHELGGFDTRYRMYCEDVELGLRCWLAGYRVELLGDLRVGHPARRATFHRLEHFRWHLLSLLRLWRCSTYAQYLQLQRSGQAP